MFGFGSQRKKATQLAIDGVRPYIGMVQGIYGIPPGYWRDPYVLGFIHTSIGLFAKGATDGRIAGAALGQVVLDTLTALSNMNGVAISQEISDLFLAKDPDFARGSSDAKAIFLYSFSEHPNQARDPLVIEATEMTDRERQSGGMDRRDEITSWMMNLSYMREIRERFG